MKSSVSGVMESNAAGNERRGGWICHNCGITDYCCTVGYALGEVICVATAWCHGRECPIRRENLQDMIH